MKLSCAIVVGCSFFSCSKDSASDGKNVFGQDGRELITTIDAPFSALGQTDSKCTATLVGKRLALTAAHCVYDSTNKKIRPDLKAFIPYAPAGSASTSRVKIKHLWFGSTTPEQDRGKDWAILLLDTVSGSSRQPMQVQAADIGAQLPFTGSLAGFSSDIDSGTGLAVHRNCQIRKIVGERLLHDCDAKAGISGGPFYVLNGSIANIVAISVSEYRQGASDSVNVPDYSDEYANVAISAAVFAPVVKALSAVDEGAITFPAIAGVQTLANPNYTSDPDQPNPPITPPTPQDFTAIAPSIRSAAVDLGTSARQMEWLGNYHHYSELSRYALLVNSYSRSIEVSVLRFLQGSLSSRDAQIEIQGLVVDLEPSVRRLTEEYQRCGPTCTRGNEQLLGAITQQLSTLRALTSSVVP